MIYKSNNPLSIREKQILELVEKGYSTSEILDILSITKYTLQCHIGRILQKLEAQNRKDAVLKAKVRGWI